MLIFLRNQVKKNRKNYILKNWKKAKTIKHLENQEKRGSAEETHACYLHFTIYYITLNDDYYYYQLRNVQFRTYTAFF